jgi:hypothetical protein
VYEAARKAHYLLFRLFTSMVACHGSMVAASVAWRRTNIGWPRDRALSRSRTAILPGGSVGQAVKTGSIMAAHCRRLLASFPHICGGSTRSVGCNDAPSGSAVDRVRAASAREPERYSRRSHRRCASAPDRERCWWRFGPSRCLRLAGRGRAVPRGAAADRVGLAIRFSSGPWLCSALPSDLASRRRPCASLI